GRPIGDVDIVASDARGLAEAAATALDTRVVEIGAQVAGGWRGRGELLRLPLDGAEHLDLTQMHPDGLDADLAARDFTVNAFALPLERLPAQGLGVITALDLEDRHGSLRDLDARVLRLVGPRALEDDPLRALRGVRLACELDFAIEPSTL